MRASRKGQKQVVQTLLDRGADVNVISTDEEATTALHLASEEGKTEVVKLLLGKNADTTIKNVCRAEERSFYFFCLMFRQNQHRKANDIKKTFAVIPV